MTFQVTQISDVGTSNPIVARLTVGLFELIDMAGSKLGKEKSDEIKSLCAGASFQRELFGRLAGPIVQE